MSSPSVMPDFPVAGLVLLGLLALVALAAWAKGPRAGAGWRAVWPKAATRADSVALRLRAQQRLDAVGVAHELEWADGGRLLVCTTRGAAPVVLDRCPHPGERSGLDAVVPEVSEVPATRQSWERRT